MAFLESPFPRPYILWKIKGGKGAPVFKTCVCNVCFHLLPVFTYQYATQWDNGQGNIDYLKLFHSKVNINMYNYQRIDQNQLEISFYNDYSWFWSMTTCEPGDLCHLPLTPVVIVGFIKILVKYLDTLQTLQKTGPICLWMWFLSGAK